MCYLGIDLGTTNIKAIVINEVGEILARADRPAELIRTSDGGIEQSLSQIYSALCEAVREVAAGLGRYIKSIGISSQGGALQLFDEHRREIGNVISWMDLRGESYDERLTAERGGEFFVEHIGACKSGICIGQLKRLAEEGTLASADGIGFVGDSIVEKLTGRAVHDPTSFAITFLYNPWKNCGDDEILSLVSANDKKLPQLLHASEIAGYLTPLAAADMNLPEGIVVSPAVHDQYAASIAAGAVEPGDVCIGTGTAWVLTATTGKLARPAIEGAYVCPHPAGGGGQLISLGTGGSAIALVMEKIGEPDFTPHRVDELIEMSPSGCNGLVCSEVTNSHISFSGETLQHTSGDYVRAVVEALAGKLRNYIDSFLKKNLRIDRLIMCGKAATSRPVIDIIADITGKEVMCLQESYVSTYGAAVIAVSMGCGEAGLKRNAIRLSLMRDVA